MTTEKKQKLLSITLLFLTVFLAGYCYHLKDQNIDMGKMIEDLHNQKSKSSLSAEKSSFIVKKEDDPESLIFISVGFFKTKRFLEKNRKALEDLSLSPIVEPRKGLMWLKIGPFKDKSVAKAHLTVLKDKKILPKDSHIVSE